MVRKSSPVFAGLWFDLCEALGRWGRCIICIRLGGEEGRADSLRRRSLKFTNTEFIL